MSADKEIAFVFDDLAIKEFTNQIKQEISLIVCGNEELQRTCKNLGFQTKSIQQYSTNPIEENKKDSLKLFAMFSKDI